MAKTAKDRTHLDMALLSCTQGKENLTIHAFEIRCRTTPPLQPTVRPDAGSQELLGLQAGLVLMLPMPEKTHTKKLLIISFGDLALPGGRVV